MKNFSEPSRRLPRFVARMLKNSSGFRLGQARHSSSVRHSSFEQLEDRLALSVTLHAGAVPDKVVVTPSETGAGFDISLAPIAYDSATTGPFDLSIDNASDQRYEIPSFGSSQLFRIDTSKSYLFSAAGNPRIGETQPGIFGYRSYDIDQLEIEVLHVGKHKDATDTHLVADLMPGDTSFLIADATGWSNEITESAESRALAWYGYADSTGNIYADYTYTRNVVSDIYDGIWAVGGITNEPGLNAYRVTLNKAWEGPALTAGSAVRNATEGSTLSEPFPSSLINLPERWQSINLTLTGEWQSGERDDSVFRPGTAYVQPVTISPSHWNNVYFGLEEEFSNSSSEAIASFGDQQFAIDLDVLAKGDWGALTSFLPGDYNLDGSVDAADYTIWRDAEGTTGIDPYSGADGNGDGEVNAQDYQIWVSNYGSNAALAALPGDYNFDGSVDAADYTIWRDGVLQVTGNQSNEPDHQTWVENYGKRISATSLPGDYNLDGSVDAADYTVWRDTHGSQVPPGVGADGNGDGLIDRRDHEVWSENYGSQLSLVIESATATHGSVSIGEGMSGQYLRYESSPWFIGSDQIEYVLRDTNTDKTVTFDVSIEVAGTNYEQNSAITSVIEEQANDTDNEPPYYTPYGYDYTYVTARDLPMHVNLLTDQNLFSPFRDSEDELVLRIESGPSNGTLEFNFDGTFNYTPHEGFVGSDAFRIEAFDGIDTVFGVINLVVLASAEELEENRLKSLALAMLNYESVNNRLPIGSNESYFDENGVPHLSWRVHILPYIGLRTLYDLFNLDEPWDSENNLPLAGLMPNMFRDPADSLDSTTTRFQTFTGPGTPFGRLDEGQIQTGPRLSQFVDGDSHTILLAQSAKDAAVGWTQPVDLDFDANNPLASLGTITSGKIKVAMADYSLVTLPTSILPEDFAALVTLNGGELVDAQALAREYHQSTEEAPFTSETEQLSRFRQLALAFHNYADVRGRFPSDTLLSPSGDTSSNVRGLSWRVLLLPYLGHQNLYDQFHLDEAWNSPHNMSLLDEMPDIYRSSEDSANSNTTRFVRPHGPETGHYNSPGSSNGYRFSSISDGTSHTLLVTETAQDQAIFWTQPNDPEFDLNNPLSVLGNLQSEEFLAAFFDGSASYLPSDISEEIFSAFVTRNGDEVIDRGTFLARKLQEQGIFKNQTQRINEYKQLILAEHNYESVFNRFSGNRFDSEGTPLLSWRVELLRFIEHENLYNQFHHDEPWDSPHNLSLLPLMPDIFRSIGDPPDSTTTRMVKFTGIENTPYPSSTDTSLSALGFRHILDGTSKTIAFLEAGPEVAEPWTKPVDRPLPDDPYTVLGTIGEEFIAARIDGSTRAYSGKMPASELRALITRNGGEIIIGSSSQTQATASAQLTIKEETEGQPSLAIQQVTADPLSISSVAPASAAVVSQAGSLLRSEASSLNLEPTSNQIDSMGAHDEALLLLSDSVAVTDSQPTTVSQDLFERLESSTEGEASESLFELGFEAL